MDLGVHVHKVVSLWPEGPQDVLTEDTLRSCMYIAVNIKMGHDSDSLSELFEHLDVARGKLERLRSLLLLAQQLGYYSLEEYEELAEEIDAVRLLIDRTVR